MIIPVNKPLGWTPLQALERFRDKNLDHKKSKITYAGRLDPMAEGVLLLVVDGTEEERREAISWGKEYEFEMIVGISTDSYDVLGLMNDTKLVDDEKNILRMLIQIKEQYLGKISQQYPPFSSKVVDGKPLWQWARDGQIEQIELPRHDIYIESIQINEIDNIKGNVLLENIVQKVKLVDGDFRQEEIIPRWQKKLAEFKNEDFPIVSMRIVCSSGTYVRQLAMDIGNAMQLPMFIYSIKRTRVGLYKIDGCIKVIN